MEYIPLKSEYRIAKEKAYREMVKDSLIGLGFLVVCFVLGAVAMYI